MPQTPNHGYNVPNEGASDWHVPLNQNFEQYDTDIEIRDQDANKGDYDPREGAKFLATDTGNVYTGDGSNWNHLPQTGEEPTISQLNPSNDFLGVGRGSRLTSAEYFGVDAPVGNASYGGMYVNTETGGWPFYGYADGGTPQAWHYYDPSENTWKLHNGGPRLAVGSNGRVGLGTVDPQTPVDVRGQNNWNLDNGDGDFRIGNDDYRLAIGVALGGAGAGGVNIRAKGGNETLNFGNSGGTALSIEERQHGNTTRPAAVVPTELNLDDRGTKMYTGNANTQAVFLEVAGDANMVLYENDLTRVFGDFDVQGNKNFVQPVETDDGEKEVVYTASEAPTPRTESSGVAELEDGRAEIDLPEHFGWVTDAEEPLVVQTTPYGGTRGLKVVERSTDRIVVEDLDGEGDYEFAYTVKGTREGQADKDVVREPTPDRTGDRSPTPADD